ncbi:DoxX family protein [Algibacter sp. Ld11]|uniref:DoxX family protein n=1 Tax=Algibacter sp. Ld11 TaxID=649150 RepID=UPI00386C9EF2
MKSINQNIGLLILRITVGGLLLFHGIKKVVDGHDFVRKVLSDANLPEFLWLGVPVAEVVAPICLILGILTRSASLLISFTMVMTIYLAYGWAGFELNQYGAFKIELNLFFLFTALSIYFTGAGKHALSERLFNSNIKLKNL